MPRVVASCITLAVSLSPMAAFVALGGPQDKSKSLDYGASIAPIFRAHCSPCHTGKQTAGGLSLESYESLMKGGSSGPTVRAGNSDKSTLVRRILGRDDLPRMPMGFKPLSDADIKQIEAWIDQGAKAPARNLTQHWAFVAPKRPSVPKVTRPVVNAIDNFVFDRLAREKLSPSPEADKATLIRRLTLDLIGLPPTPAEVDAYVADRSPNAYERVVDRLLANPHYGERMALPWLDAARYADSNGFQQDGDTFQYVWRDWVVRALNANMPFDQFTVEQLAGDLLPKATLDQLVATAFNRNHMLNGEGGAIPEEQRSVNLFDRVDTTSATWLGLTMGCARCHDHKYDPLTQKDYYSMMAYFNRVPETGVPAGSGQYRIADPWIYAGSPGELAALAQAEANVSMAKSAVSAFMASPAFNLDFNSWRTRALEALDRATYGSSPWSEVGTFVGSSFDQAFTTVYGPENGWIKKSTVRPDLQDGKVHPLSGDNTAFYFQRSIRVDRDVDYLLSLGSDDGIKVWVNGKEVLIRKVTRGAEPDSDRVIVRLKKGENQVLMKIVNGGGIGGFYFLGLAGGVDDKTAQNLRAEKPDLDQLKGAFANSVPSEKLKALQSAVRGAESQVATLKEGLPRVMVMSDAKPRKTFVFHRGNYEDLGEEVEPSTPSSLAKLPTSKDRLGLARWIVSRANPLTARVQVNRSWQLFFGRGLVRTEENFGLKGEPPTHPELLDWLAVDLMESGWNMKRLHKQIVMSRTYRQSSKLNATARQRDPANLLFARAPRFRLPSMLLRDTALAASGLLDPKIGGKPVYPYQPKGIWDGLAITLERDFTYPQSSGADNHRRSLYTFWRRTAAPGNMFDSSSRQVCTVKPTLTSTPLHALTMLNDVTWVEAGRALALSVSSKPGDRERLSEAFRRVCSRRPQPKELTILVNALDRSKAAYQESPRAALQYLSQGDSKLPKLNPKQSVEIAALSAVCVAIFNLDEAMTRE